MAVESVATPKVEPVYNTPDIGNLIKTFSGLHRPAPPEDMKHYENAARNSIDTLWNGIHAIGELIELAGGNTECPPEPDTMCEIGEFMRMLGTTGRHLSLAKSNASFWQHHKMADEEPQGGPQE